MILEPKISVRVALISVKVAFYPWDERRGSPSPRDTEPIAVSHFSSHPWAWLNSNYFHHLCHRKIAKQNDKISRFSSEEVKKEAEECFLCVKRFTSSHKCKKMKLIVMEAEDEKDHAEYPFVLYMKHKQKM